MPRDEKPRRRAKKTRRGSPQAIAKRRAARAFNDLLEPGGRSALDGRTQKRILRLKRELSEGVNGQGRSLKPLEILQHVDELLELGESLGELKKLRAPRPQRTLDDELAKLLPDLHAAYGFRVEAYAFVGVSAEALRRAGIKKPRNGGSG